jgi:RNA polymerase sigma-32 factor
MQAVKKFEPEKGFRLATYAMWWIKASIQEYVLRSWSLVKMGTTTAQKKLFFNLKKIKNQLASNNFGDLKQEHVEEISKRLNVKKEEVVSMNRRLLGKEKSLNDPIKNEDGAEWQDWLVDDKIDQELKLSQQQELSERKKLMSDKFHVLNAREKQILTARRLSDDIATLENLSKKYKISRERVRQIENKAFEKLQKAMLSITKSNNLLTQN